MSCERRHSSIAVANSDQQATDLGCREGEWAVASMACYWSELWFLPIGIPVPCGSRNFTSGYDNFLVSAAMFIYVYFICSLLASQRVNIPKTMRAARAIDSLDFVFVGITVHDHCGVMEYTWIYVLFHSGWTPQWTDILVHSYPSQNFYRTS